MSCKVWIVALLVGLSWQPAVMAINFNAAGRPSSDLERDSSSKADEIIKLAGIKPGMTVADLFGGGGYYSELLSQAVGPSGKVYLHNNKAMLPYFKEDLAARNIAKRLPNVIRYDREPDNFGFKENSLDGVFLVLIYHDFFYQTLEWRVSPIDVFEQIKKALKPDGVVVLIDHHAKEGERIRQAEKLHRIDAKFARVDLKKRGFKIVQESKVLANPQDSRQISVFHKSIRRKTDRFVWLLKVDQ